MKRLGRADAAGELDYLLHTRAHVERDIGYYIPPPRIRRARHVKLPRIFIKANLLDFYLYVCVITMLAVGKF